MTPYWIKPYFAVGSDPPLTALPFLVLALGCFVVAVLYPRQRPR